jgi:hypothetical protein
MDTLEIALIALFISSIGPKEQTQTLDPSLKSIVPIVCQKLLYFRASFDP